MLVRDCMIVGLLLEVSSVFEFSRLVVVHERPPSRDIESATSHGRRLAENLDDVFADVAVGDALALTRTSKNHQIQIPSNTLGLNAPGADTTRENFVAAQKLMDAAASVGMQKEERSFKNELGSAIGGQTTLGIQDSSIADVERHSGTQNQPDLSKCPVRWYQHGSVCHADSLYEGQCGSRIDLNVISTQQKLAFARFCKVSFPPLQLRNCNGLALSAPCPSLWYEIDDSICQAPENYRGNCDAIIDTSTMSTEDKYKFGEQCGARWPCESSPSHDYRNTCPAGWSLQFGSICFAPNGYEGRCDSTMDLIGASVEDKQELEEICKISWPDAPAGCRRDHVSPCPYGWWQEVTPKGANSCVAPSVYAGKCNHVQVFDGMSPVEKTEWEHVCQAFFPCRDRDGCFPEWSAACPAGWFEFEGGRSCLAPLDYAGNCSVVLQGLRALSNEEKAGIANECGVSWPCFGEAT